MKLHADSDFGFWICMTVLILCSFKCNGVALW